MNKMLYALAVGLCLLCLPNLLNAQCDVTPSIVTTSTGLGYVEIDSTDSQVINLMTNSTSNAGYIYALTGTDFNIIRFINGPSADISDLNAGKYFIWGFSYTGTINLVPGQLVFTGSFSTGCFQISNTAVVIQKLNDGGGTTPSTPCDSLQQPTVFLAGPVYDTTIVLDSVADPLVFFSTPTTGPNFNFTLVVTDSAGNVLSVPSGNMIDFNNSTPGIRYVYGLVYQGNLNATTGDNIDDGDLASGCSIISSNFVTIHQIPDTTSINPCDSLDAALISLLGGATDTSFVLDSIVDSLTFVSNIGTNPAFNFTYVVTDTAGHILSVPTGNVISFNNDNYGTTYVYGLAYVGNLSATIGEVIDSIDLASECFELSSNFVSVNYTDSTGINPCDSLDAALISLLGGATDTTFVLDSLTDSLTFVSNIGTNPAFNFTYVVTDSAGHILSVPTGNVINFNNTVSGTTYVYGLAYVGNLSATIGGVIDSIDLASYCFELSSNFVSINYTDSTGVNPCDSLDAALISLLGGATDTTFVLDSLTDSLTFVSNIGTNPAFNFTYVVTDTAGHILSVPTGDVLSFNNTVSGTTYVYGLAYVGNLTATIGELIDSIDLASECFELSSNFVSVNYIDSTGANNTGQFFVSSNTSGVIGVYSVDSNGNVTFDSFPGQGLDADGIYYDMENDVLYQLNRTGSVLNAYSNVNDSLSVGALPLLTATSTTGEFTNGREIAFLGGRLVVTQDADAVNNNMNRLLVYDATSTGFTLVNSYDVDINLWGVQAVGSSLYAVVDNSNKLAIYDNFFSNVDGAISPSKTITVEGIVRTHGLSYDEDTDVLLLTDVGDATSNSDGAFVVINDFTTAIADSIVSTSEQIRVSGPQSFLGNPVDIAFDADNDIIYIAERLNGGGRVLGFNVPTVSGDMAPVYNDLFAGASAISFPSSDDNLVGNAANLFVSSNTQSKVGVVNVLNNNLMQLTSFNSQGTDADGIYYDRDNDLLYQFNRTGNVVNTYSDVSNSIEAGIDPVLFGTSTSDAINGREIAVSGDRLVVAQDAITANGDTNKFMVYNINGGNLTLSKTFDVDVNLWGIHADGETLYAVVDNSNLVVRYDNFSNQPGGTLSASDSVEIEGLVRAHGLTYDAAIDAMILTDIGDAASANDGAIIVISNWTTASADGFVSMDEQIRVEGSLTLLGNPVDVAWDKQRSMIYVAERLNGGGRILGFRLPTADGNVAPVYNQLFAGASAVYLNDADGQFFQGNGSENQIFATPGSFRLNTLAAYPNPASHYMNIQWVQQHAQNGDEAIVRILDNNGRTLQVRNVDVWEGTVTVSLILDQLQSGMYHVIVENGYGATFHQRFIKE